MVNIVGSKRNTCKAEQPMREKIVRVLRIMESPQRSTSARYCTSDRALESIDFLQ